MQDGRPIPFDAAPTYSEFSDPRLVAIYDVVNPVDEYSGFYIDLAAQQPVSSIIDIGCGTGQLTCELAKRGYQLIGLEPSGALLDIARSRPCGGQVTWINGGTDQLHGSLADLAIMTGHVAQFFLDDESWQAALVAIRTALKPAGHLAFESRNPLVQPWAASGAERHIDWPAQTLRRAVHDPVAGPVEWWVEFAGVAGGLAQYEIHYLFTRVGEELVSVNRLRFRSREEIYQSLEDAGFSVEQVFGDWDRRPASADTRELIFVATPRIATA